MPGHQGINIGFVGSIACLLACAFIANAVVSRRKKHGDFPQFLSIPDVSHKREGSFSDESDGLLSMKNYNSNSQYQALQSDSSSEDLISQHEP